MTPDCSPEGLKKSVDECLRILDGKKFIDIFEPARVDPKVPIEKTVSALAEYVNAGKIGGIGLSEVSAETIRKAHEVHPIASVEVEFSLFSTDLLTNGVGTVCNELNIPILGYAPLSHGWLTGKLRKFEDIPEGDYRRRQPRFQPDVFGENLKVVDEIAKISKEKGCTMPQIAIAWARSQSGRPGLPTILPLPGATKVSRVLENLADIKLSQSEVDEIQQTLDRLPIQGARYGGELAKLSEQ